MTTHALGPVIGKIGGGVNSTPVETSNRGLQETEFFSFDPEGVPHLIVLIGDISYEGSNPDRYPQIESPEGAFPGMVGNFGYAWETSSPLALTLINNASFGNNDGAAVAGTVHVTPL